jgi:hypothetical protein
VGLLGSGFAGTHSTNSSAYCWGKERTMCMTLLAVDRLTILHSRSLEPALEAVRKGLGRGLRRQNQK